MEDIEEAEETVSSAPLMKANSLDVNYLFVQIPNLEDITSP